MPDLERKLKLVQDLDSDGHIVEWEDKKREWSIRMGFEHISLLTHEDRPGSFLFIKGSYPLISLDNVSFALEHEYAQLKERYQDLTVCNFVLIIPQNDLTKDSENNQVSPFALSLKCSKDSAVIVSFQGLNPLTYTSAIGELAYERVTAWGKEVSVQNWIPLVKDKEFRLHGFPTNPVLMHQSSALIRQTVLTPNKHLSVAQYFINGGEPKSALSFLFFEKMIVIRNKGESQNLSYPVSNSLSSPHQDAEFVVAAAGLFNDNIPNDNSYPSSYSPNPRLLLRFHPMSEIGYQQWLRKIIGDDDVFTSMRIKTVG